jgi:hypothetical protein
MGDGPMEVLWAIALQARRYYGYLWWTMAPYGGWCYGGPMGDGTSGWEVLWVPIGTYSSLWGMVLWRSYGPWHFRLGVPMGTYSGL